MRVARALFLIVGVTAAIVLAPCATVLTVPPDAPAPAELQPKLETAKHAVVHGLERGWTRATSRCRSLADVDPRMMSGGVVNDFATDPELQHLRSPTQPRCAQS